MQQLQFVCRNYSRLTILQAVFAFFLLGITSCTGSKKEDEDKKNGFDADCMTLTKTQINNNWVPDYTDPTNPVKDKIAVLKFYSYPIPGKDGYTVSVQAFNNTNSPLGKPIDLNTGVACGINLPSLVTGHSNDIELSKLNMFDAKGKLVNDFSKIILTPGQYDVEGFSFLKYAVTVAIGDSRSEPIDCLPCPPCINCIPSCPDKCLPACIQKDTAKQMIPRPVVNTDTFKSK